MRQVKQVPAVPCLKGKPGKGLSVKGRDKSRQRGAGSGCRGKAVQSRGFWGGTKGSVPKDGGRRSRTENIQKKKSWGRRNLRKKLTLSMGSSAGAGEAAVRPKRIRRPL